MLIFSCHFDIKHRLTYLTYNILLAISLNVPRAGLCNSDFVIAQLSVRYAFIMHSWEMIEKYNYNLQHIQPTIEYLCENIVAI